jgi:hypothetical protein
MFHGTTYQNGKKYSKRPLNKPTLPFQGPIKFTQILIDFWYENTYTIWQPRFKRFRGPGFYFIETVITFLCMRVFY